jgi:signal transduction histidine kinase
VFAMDSLENRFIKYILVFILAVLLISSIVFYIPIEQSVVNDKKDEITHEIQLNFKDINYGIESHEADVNALTSRTMIRKKLFSYIKGQMTLTELRNYTQSKYVDGSKVYDDLLASRRISSDNKVIAHYGNQTLLNNHYEPEKEFEVIHEMNQTFIYIKEPIEHDNFQLGYDVGLFNATPIFDNCKSNDYYNCVDYDITKPENLDDYYNLNNKNVYTSKLEEKNYYLVASYKKDLLNGKLSIINFYMSSFVLILIFTLLPLSYFTIFRESREIIQMYKQSTTKLEKSNEFKDTFTDIIRHDLLNPANVIGGYVKLLINKENDTSKIQMLKKIQSSNYKIIELLENASEFAKLENIENIEFENRDIVKIIKKAINDFQFQLNDKNIKSEVLTENEYLCRINPMIEQVVANLLSNAIKYSPEKSTVKIYITDKGNFWRINIADSGEGIPDEDKPYLFDRFSRRDKKGIKGTGFGLAIVNMIVDLHGGDVGVDDNPEGKGSMFWFTLVKHEQVTN